jgi:hypothetical protein
MQKRPGNRNLAEMTLTADTASTGSAAGHRCMTVCTAIPLLRTPTGKSSRYFRCARDVSFDAPAAGLREPAPCERLQRANRAKTRQQW